MNQKGFAVPLIILGVVVLIIVIVGVFYLGKTTTQKPFPSPSPVVIPETPIPSPTLVPKQKDNTIAVSLGQQFTLKKGQVAKITDAGLELEITAFFNSPCPAESRCVWSGVGVGFEYRFNGQVQKGVNLVQAFGYQTTIIKTDYETYADLIIERMKQFPDSLIN